MKKMLAVLFFIQGVSYAGTSTLQSPYKIASGSYIKIIAENSVSYKNKNTLIPVVGMISNTIHDTKTLSLEVIPQDSKIVGYYFNDSNKGGGCSINWQSITLAGNNPIEIPVQLKSACSIDSDIKLGQQIDLMTTEPIYR